jgi:hypothetical protein
MRLAILPMVIHHEPQFVPAGNDVLIKLALLGCVLSGQMTLSKPSYKQLMPWVEVWPLLMRKARDQPASSDEEASHGELD